MRALELFDAAGLATFAVQGTAKTMTAGVSSLPASRGGDPVDAGAAAASR